MLELKFLIVQIFTKIFKARKFENIHKEYKKSIEKIKEKVARGEKIKVAFLHVLATSCQELNIFEKMLEKDSIFDPYFIVCPDVYRSKENFDFNYNRTKNELIKKYGNERVLDGYDYAKDEFQDYTSEFDLITTSNPYEGMVHKYFRISYWAKKYIPIFYMSYFYMGRCHTTISNLKNTTFSYIWKVFVENNYTLKLAKKYEIIKGKNIIVAGASKMDTLAKIKPLNKKRPMIIIAPHHTIDTEDNKQVGGFLQYSDILLNLPKKYKEIDFVFRPHPILFENLRAKYWGIEKSEKYLEELLSNKNVIYSTSGEYMDLFANSDALIHDCGSFGAEYLYTGKPCAYLYKKGIKPKEIWTKFGRKSIDMHYVMYSEKDVIDFIERVVLKGDDYKKDIRKKYAKKHIMFNYPNSADFIFDNLEKSFK